MTKAKIFFHGNCFDGAISAALFTNFFKQYHNGDVEFEYTPLSHEPGFSYDERMFTGDENIVLDFRYPPSEKVTWWFDHHRTTFINNEDRNHLKNRSEDDHFHWNPDAPSNSSMMLAFFKNHFDFETDDWHEELIKWADIIDDARFDSPDLSVELIEPAIGFASLLEHDRNDEIIQQFISELSSGATLENMSSMSKWSKKLNNIRQKTWDMVEDVKSNIEVIDRVSFVDLSQNELSGFNKFIPYYLFPEIKYSVAILKYDKVYKISVGLNPWVTLNGNNSSLDIGLLCEKHGGGGHYSVGAIPFPHDKLKEAEKICKEITDQLRKNSVFEIEKRKQDTVEDAKNF